MIIGVKRYGTSCKPHFGTEKIWVLMQHNVYNVFFITMKGMKIMKGRELSAL
jgi:hypothetical protein